MSKVGSMVSKEAAADFLALLQKKTATFQYLISTNNGDWSVKGFIDVFKNIYTISGDTKVVSKLIEIMLFPQFVSFAAENNLKLILSSEQNHYPDLTFIDSQEHKFAVDLKSTYRVTNTPMNTMTLGAFTTKNIGAVNTISDLLKGTGPFASL